ncbi:MAG: DUF4252 domain-containing protein [Alistipes sp.]|nr:DUF4252 domain-containing protein [Alistipes sp.]
MKKFIVLIALLLPLSVMAAEPLTSTIADKYDQTEGVTVVNLEGAMLQAMIASQADSIEDAAEAAKYLNAIRVITCEKKSISSKIRKDVEKLIKKAKLQPFVDMPEEGVKIYTQGEDGTIAAIIVYVVDDGDVTLVEISGNFSSEMINDIININIA